MTPNWLVRLNFCLAWLNPALGVIALVLAAMVVATAAGRTPVEPFKSAAAVMQVAQQQPASAACARAALPPEWQELSRYD